MLKLIMLTQILILIIYTSIIDVSNVKVGFLYCEPRKTPGLREKGIVNGEERNSKFQPKVDGPLVHICDRDIADKSAIPKNEFSNIPKNEFSVQRLSGRLFLIKLLF